MSIEVATKLGSQSPLRQAQREQVEAAQGREVLAESLQGSDRQKEAEQAQKTAQELPLEAKEIGEVVDKLNEVLDVGNRQLQFRVDNDANRTVISVLDQESGEKIRQIPSEDVLRLVSRMQEMGDGVDKAVGVLIDSKI